MNKYRNYCIYTVLIILLLSLVATISVDAKTDKPDKKHKNEVGGLEQEKCKSCHDKINKKDNNKDNLNKNTGQNTGQNTGAPKIYSAQNMGGSIRGMGTNGNLSAIVTTGQTPYQIGATFGNWAGWSWWDNDQFGTERQKNIVYLTILDNSSGTIKPVPGLAPSAWPFASYRKYSGSYSYKADTGPSPISVLKNYPDMTDLFMIRKVDLRSANSATLTFWTWYAMETDWDYAYVVVSWDNGSSWTTIEGSLTTNSNPNGNNMGNGITGNSVGSWVKETMVLSGYIGQEILVGFRFKSDQAVNDEGIYVDDIEIKDGNNVILSDNAEAFVEGQTMSVNITYPNLIWSGLQYSQHTRQIDLREDTLHPGTYYGYFNYDPFGEQYSGDYDVTLDVTIGGTQITAGTQFQTTIFGCEKCHNKIGSPPGTETNTLHGEGGGMQSCMYICHSGSRSFYYSLDPNDPIYMGPPLTANPMHVHEMKYGHEGGFFDGAWYTQPNYTVPSHVNSTPCIECHTSFIHDNTGTDTFNIASLVLSGTNVPYSLGNHSGMFCENCHGELTYPPIPQDQFQISDTIGDYNPSFTSSESFTGTFIVDVKGPEDLNLTVHGGTVGTQVLLYVLGPIDNTSTALQGPCGGDPCARIAALPIDMNIPGPYIGTWLVKVIALQPGILDYTVLSNYPIERKPIIKIPECKDCHNSNGQGGAYTTLNVPNWNPGFAHADTNGDNILDIQCRMCHDTIHNIGTKTCKDCHASAPTGHVVKEPEYSQYTMSQCLSCHGDPHAVKSGGEQCIECHGTNYTGEAPSSSMLVDIGLFGASIHQNINQSMPTGVVTNEDCWMCHDNKDMNRNNVRKCGYCHNKASRWHGDANVTTNLTALAQK